MLAPKFITIDEFDNYWSANLREMLRTSANPSNQAELFLARVENRLMAYIDNNTFRRYEYEELQGKQLAAFKEAIILQAMYVYKNGDIGMDSGYDAERGSVINRANLVEISVCQDAIDALSNAGLWNLAMKNKPRIGSCDTVVSSCGDTVTSGKYLKKDGTDAMEGELNMNSFRIFGLGDPLEDSDATNKKYVDSKLFNDKLKLSDTYLNKVSANTLVRPYLNGNGEYQEMVNNVFDSEKHSQYQKRTNFDGENDKCFIDTHLGSTSSIYTAATGDNSNININLLGNNTSIGATLNGNNSYIRSVLDGYSVINFYASGNDTNKSLDYCYLSSGYNGDDGIGSNNAPLLFFKKGGTANPNKYGLGFDTETHNLGYITKDDNVINWFDFDYLKKLTTQGLKIYAHSGASQFELDYDILATVNSIAQRTASGNILMTDPVEDLAGVNKQYLENNYVPKSTTTGNYVYSHENDVQSEVEYSALCTNSSLVQRNAEGSISIKAVQFKNGTWLDVQESNGPLVYLRKTQETDSNYALTTKSYVDTQIAKIDQFSYIVSTNAATTPLGIVWYDGETKVEGTLVASANTEYIIYLVPCKHSATETQKGYDEYLTLKSNNVYSWEVLGNTADIDLSEIADANIKTSQISNSRLFNNSLEGIINTGGSNYATIDGPKAEITNWSILNATFGDDADFESADVTISDPTTKKNPVSLNYLETNYTTKDFVNGEVDTLFEEITNEIDRATKEETAINAKIPSAASSTNLLADRNWVTTNAGTTIATTWNELKTLRDSSQLIKGATYRITDYQCTTTQFDTQSAGHQFDILVIADDVNVLNENARAVIHSGDTYFANSKLSAWELKYSLDNDTDRFAWASNASSNPKIYTIDLWFEYKGTLDIDGTTYYLWYNSEFNWFEEGTLGYLATTEQQPSIGAKTNVVNIDTPAIVNPYYTPTITNALFPSTENGKGVIYYMKDEFDNECHYDFKNIQFKRIATLVSSSSSYSSYNDSVFNSYHYWATTDYTPSGLKLDEGTITPEYIWAYTFHDAINNSDGSLNNAGLVYNNSIDTYQVYVSIDETNENKVIQLNDIVLYYQVIDDENFYGIYNNKFKNNCHTITISQNCYSNIFNDGCYENTFGNGCNNNVFSSDCYDNTFGNECSFNAFGNHCYDNKFSNNCNYNIFGRYVSTSEFNYNCSYNIFGSECIRNFFNYNCSYNTLNERCQGQQFGYGCNYNILGAKSSSLIFGNACEYNIFGRSCRYITLENYAQNNAFDDNVWYLLLTSSATGSYSSYIQNIHIHSGIQGDSSRNQKTITVERNLSYSVDYYANNSKTIILDD